MIPHGLSIPEPQATDVPTYPAYPSDPYDTRSDCLDRDGDGEMAAA